MNKEIELLELLIKTEIRNFGIYRPIESYSDELKIINERINSLNDEKEKLTKEYESRLEHEQLLADTKTYIEQLKEKEGV